MDIRVSPPQFEDYLSLSGHLPLRRARLKDLQINLGYLCNQACEHCHVEAGPKRTELMTWETMEKILAWIKKHNVQSIDLTGGAPEMNPHFQRLVETARGMDVSVISRCNLTILNEPGYEYLSQWYADQGVRLVSSLPCYTKVNVDTQRGKGVFERSIRALQALNAVGYGIEPDKPLDLVYNPGGAFLPPSQESLEQDYKTRLRDDFGIEFSQLLTITNLPINRFAHYLKREGKYDDYLRLLADHFNPGTLEGLMCRHLLSIDWQGRTYDCDFNQMLGMGVSNNSSDAADPPYLWDIDADQLTDSPVKTGAHCFGCTAGAGSSCGGALDS